MACSFPRFDRLLFVCCALIFTASASALESRADEVIRVGILHSLTGPMAESEKPVADTTLFAIEQINQQGGLLGHRIEAIVADGKSDEATFAKEAERLVSEEKVSVIFGCWTSASRKAVLPVLERHNQLLFYPLQYEGMEQSAHIIYTGAAPNQQIIPAVNWGVRKFGPRVYLLGSDYIYPHATNWLIAKQIPLLAGKIVGERYIPLGSTDMSGIIDDIKDLHPDVIFNSINGNSNKFLFSALKQAGITAADTPVVSFSMGETELATMNADTVQGHYVASNYFQSLPGQQNQIFLAAMQARFGNQPVSDPMQSAWIGVHLWANTVSGANTWQAEVIRHSVLHQSLPAPEGIVSVDSATRHLWKTIRIGRINAQQQPEVIWSSDEPIRPYPYPLLISKHESDQFLGKLYDSWGGQWTAPAAAKTP